MRGLAPARANRQVNNTSATIYLRRFDAGGVIIEREDSAGETAGLVSVYEGKIAGKRIEGEVTKSWLDHWYHPKQGKFTATITEPSDFSLETEYRLLKERKAQQANRTQGPPRNE